MAIVRAMTIALIFAAIAWAVSDQRVGNADVLFTQSGTGDETVVTTLPTGLFELRARHSGQSNFAV